MADIVQDKELERQIETFNLVPSDGGRFEFSVNGELVFSKLKTFRHAEEGHPHRRSGHRHRVDVLDTRYLPHPLLQRDGGPGLHLGRTTPAAGKQAARNSREAR